MYKFIGIAALVAVVGAASAQLQTVAIKVGNLHCEGCVAPVVQGIKAIKGVQAADLSYKTGIASVRFDEAKVTVSQIVNALPSIPHAMGPKFGKYSGLLSVKLMRGDPARAAASVSKVAGVAKATVDKGALHIAFKPNSLVKMAQIDQAITKSGGQR